MRSATRAFACLLLGLLAWSGPHAYPMIPRPRAASGANPTIAATNTGPNYTGGANTSTNANLPASIGAGDLLVVWLARDGAASSVIDCGSGGEYTETQDQGVTDTTFSLMTAYKTAGGSEGASVTCSWTGGENGGSHSARLTNWSAISAITRTTGNSASPNCGSVSFTAPARVICGCAIDGNSTPIDFTADPSGYTLLGAGSFGQAANNSSRGRVVEQRFAAGSSDDPAAFSITSTQGWACHAFAVED